MSTSEIWFSRHCPVVSLVQSGRSDSTH